MLAVVHKGREHEIEKILEKWDLTYNIIGEVTNTGNVEYWMDGEKKAEIPADSLALGGGAPVYHREWEEPAYYTKNKSISLLMESTKVFWTGMSNIFVTVVTLVITAGVFAKGLISLGFIQDSLFWYLE